MSMRARQFNRLDRDIVEISQYFEGEPVIIELLSAIGQDWDFEFIASCVMYCDDYTFELKGQSNHVTGAIKNLLANVRRHQRKNQPATDNKSGEKVER